MRFSRSTVRPSLRDAGSSVWPPSVGSSPRLPSSSRSARPGENVQTPRARRMPALPSTFAQVLGDLAREIWQGLEHLLDHSRRHLPRHRGFDVRTRVYQVNRSAAMAAFHCGWKTGDALLLDEGEHILRVPRGHFLVGPDLRADTVQGLKAVFSKKGYPIRRPLFVDVMRAALTWNGRGKDHHVA